jgi:hypothetical protein
MRRTLATIALAAGFLLAGCTTLGSLLSGNSVAQQAPQTIEVAEKGLTVVHLAYNGAGIALQQAAASGLLHGDAAAKAKSVYDQVGDAIQAADAADAAANAQGVFTQVAAAQDLLAQLVALIPKQ